MQGILCCKLPRLGLQSARFLLYDLADDAMMVNGECSAACAVLPADMLCICCITGVRVVYVALLERLWVLPFRFPVRSSISMPNYLSLMEGSSVQVKCYCVI